MLRRNLAVGLFQRSIEEETEEDEEEQEKYYRLDVHQFEHLN